MLGVLMSVVIMLNVVAAFGLKLNLRIFVGIHLKSEFNKLGKVV
jgi:hypothetical protein